MNLSAWKGAPIPPGLWFPLGIFTLFHPVVTYVRSYGGKANFRMIHLPKHFEDFFLFLEKSNTTTLYTRHLQNKVLEILDLL